MSKLSILTQLITKVKSSFLSLIDTGTRKLFWSLSPTDTMTELEEGYEILAFQMLNRGIQNDCQIEQLIREKKLIIDPFCNSQVKHECAYPYDPKVNVISYGLSSFGYDIRLNYKDFYVFKHLPGKLVDPKNFNPDFLEKQEYTVDEKTGHNYFIIPANSYALGVSVEYFKIPSDVVVVCLAKSTYARAGIAVNITPLEPDWEGYLTLEIANQSSSDVKVYAKEGIAQLLFFKGGRPTLTYKDRQGKYMGQAEKVIFSKV